MFVEFDNGSFLSVAGRLKSEPSFGAAVWPHLRPQCGPICGAL